MTEPDNFSRMLEDLEVPQVGDLRHREFLRRSILSARRSAALTIWYLLVPAYILLCAVMKAAFMREPHLFAVFDGVVRELGRSPLGETLPTLLLLGLPLGAVLLNLAVLVRACYVPDNAEWRTVVRRRPVNLLILLLGLLASGLYVVYLLFRA